jgi:hypothetical protein
MKKLMTAAFLLLILLSLNTQVFARTLNCHFKHEGIRDVESIQLKDDNLLLNQQMEIPLEKSTVRCANFGKQTRLDGLALGYQIVLKSCTSDAQLEGHLIDSVHQEAAAIVCN